MSRRCQSDEDWHQVSCHSFPCQRRFCRRRRRGGGCCCCGRLPQSACVLFQSPSQSIIHCDRARRREGEREAAGRREREAAGRREAGSREGRRQRAERSWGSAGRARSQAARAAARPGGRRPEPRGPPCPGRASAEPRRRRRLAPFGPVAGRALSRVRRAGLRTRTDGRGPRLRSGRAGSGAPGAPGTRGQGLRARAGAGVQAARGWGGGAPQARLRTAGLLHARFSPASGALRAGADSAPPAWSCLRAAGSRSSPGLGPSERGQGAAGCVPPGLGLCRRTGGDSGTRAPGQGSRIPGATLGDPRSGRSDLWGYRLSAGCGESLARRGKA